jgi:hypothetical protein
LPARAEDFEDQEAGEAFAELVDGGRVDGLLIASARPENRLLDALERHRGAARVRQPLRRRPARRAVRARTRGGLPGRCGRARSWEPPVARGAFTPSRRAVPADLSVIAYDELPVAAFLSPPVLVERASTAPPPP